MSLDADQRRLMRGLLRKGARAELKRLFALIRAHDDRALLAALAAGKRKLKRPRDPLVRDLELALKPILAPAAEKAEMLVEHLSRRHRRKLAFEGKGLAEAARRCRAVKLSDEQIRAGARTLVANLAKRHGRESVV